MVVDDASSAQIELILASNDPKQARQLLTDLEASRYAYSFVCLSIRETLVEKACRQILCNVGKTPIVMVIDGAFAAAECEPLLQFALNTKSLTAIQCVVTNPPADAKSRDRLINLGARLFDGEPGQEGSTLLLN